MVGKVLRRVLKEEEAAKELMGPGMGLYCICPFAGPRPYCDFKRQDL